LEKIYREIFCIRKRIEALERMILPVDEMDPEELEEIRVLKGEAKKDRVPWSQIKGKVEKMIVTLFKMFFRRKHGRGLAVIEACWAHKTDGV